MNLPPQIGRYRIIDFLGQGAMGVVYRGRDEALERDVALKVMSIGQADADGRMRFEREAKAAAKLQHPNIVTIYELGAHDGAPFMALELLEGVDLQRAIEGGLRPNPKVNLPIVLQLLSGLGHAHENGIVHRDVKPSNIFLPRGRPAKIMDFGVARLAGGMTTAGMVVGTPNYMSPEQVRAGPIDGRSDLFSAGLILYELVTGEKAYQADSVVALLFKIAHEDPKLALIPKGPGWERLRGVLARSLARNPDDRYPDARAMASDLAQAHHDLGGTADWATASDVGLMVRTTPRPSRAASFGTPSPSPAPEASTPSTPAVAPAATPQAPAIWTSPTVVASALGAASLLILAFALYTLTRPQVPEPARPTAPPTAPAGTGQTPPPPTPTAIETRPKPSPRPPPSATLTPRASAQATTTPEETIPPGPALADARLDRANDLMERGRFAAALAEAKAVLRREPANADAKALVEDAEVAIVVESRIKKAKEALKKGDTDAALEEIRAGLAVAPSDGRLLALFKEATR